MPSPSILHHTPTLQANLPRLNTHPTGLTLIASRKLPSGRVDFFIHPSNPLETLVGKVYKKRKLVQEVGCAEIDIPDDMTNSMDDLTEFLVSKTSVIDSTFGNIIFKDILGKSTQKKQRKRRAKNEESAPLLGEVRHVAPQVTTTVLRSQCYDDLFKFIQAGDFEGVKLCFEPGAPPLNINFLSRRQEVVSWESIDGQKIHTKTRWLSDTALTTAVKHLKIEMVKFFLGRGANPNVVVTMRWSGREIPKIPFDVFQDTSLSIALRKKSTKIVELLLEAGANVNFRSKEYIETLCNRHLRVSKTQNLFCIFGCNIRPLFEFWSC